MVKIQRRNNKNNINNPDDRSKNDPNTIVDSKKVLGIYNQEHNDEEDMQKVTQKVQE